MASVSTSTVCASKVVGVCSAKSSRTTFSAVGVLAHKLHLTSGVGVGVGIGVGSGSGVGVGSFVGVGVSSLTVTCKVGSFSTVLLSICLFHYI